MTLVNLKFEQRKWILKCYWKTENVEYPPRSPDVTLLDSFLRGALNQWYSTFFVRVPPDIISLQLCTPKVVGTKCKLYILYNLRTP
jgi:hypothetical protein